jgi:hypothetical protein
MSMDKHLSLIKTAVFDKCVMTISNFQTEMESKEYAACRFQLNGLNILYRHAKVTPKKAGQFVTFWKRSDNGPIAPFSETDMMNFYTVSVSNGTELGQFVFPKSVLIEKGIISTEKNAGKRAFRVYPSWYVLLNKQAQKTQNWQLTYFYIINDAIDCNRIKELYSSK